MFSNLLFLILVLMVINLAPEASPGYFELSSGEAFLAGMALYCAILLLFVVQNTLFRRLFGQSAQSGLPILANCEFVLFLATFFFALGADRFYLQVPWIAHSLTLTSLFPLFLYFLALGIFHCIHFSSSHGPKHISEGVSRWHHSLLQIRFLLPFALPFIFFNFLIDLSQLFPQNIFMPTATNDLETPLEFLSLTAGTLIFLVLTMIFFPYFMQQLWGCKELPDGDLKRRLQLLCERARFKYAGMKTWPVMKQALTAAIIGVLPRFRYVMFTEALLHKLPPEEVEAVLAHEIGHSYRRHLLIYPTLIIGMLFSLGILSMLFMDPLDAFFSLKILNDPLGAWKMFYPITILLFYILSIALYFRFVFGFFSRNFERQADLHCFNLGISSEYMIRALDRIAIASGHIHKQPSWHHYSIQERIDFLQEAETSPRLILKHHRRVHRILWGYFFLLTIGLFFLISPFLQEYPVAKQVTLFTEQVNETLKNLLTHP